MTDKEINTNKYFVERTDIGGGTIGYTVPFPEELLREIIKQNKQLKRKEQECEELKEKYEALKLENQEGYEIVAELKHECEELKNNLHIANTNHEAAEQECDRYRKALEEIEEHYEKVVKNLTTYDDSYDANISIEALHNISDIINKAKGEGKCQ